MKKELSVDLAIIGAGTAGISAFKEASTITKNILLVDSGPLGTTCARVGCMPSKTFIQVANYFHDRCFFSERGIKQSEQLSIDIPKMMSYVTKMRDSFTTDIIKYLYSLEDRFIQGEAEILEPCLMKVGEQIVKAKSIIIATGSHSYIPSEWQDFSNQILVSENFFEQKDFERKIGIIGGGIIGLELGQALHRIGIDITLFHSKNFIGKLTDPVINDHAIKLLQQEFPLYIQHRAKVHKDKELLVIKSEERILKVKQMLAAIGRKSNLQALNLAKLGIKTDHNGIPLHDPATMQINNLPIFMAGDVNQAEQLLHIANDQGRIAGHNAVQSSQRFQQRVPLMIVFTDPNIAIVGQTFRDLEGSNFMIGEVQFEHQGRARIMSKNKGILHVYAEPKYGKILGAEMIAPAGEHLAHLLAWAIQQKLSVMDLLKMPFYHPTIEEGLRTALNDLLNQIKVSI